MRRALLLVPALLALGAGLGASTSDTYAPSSQSQPLYGRLASARSAALGGAFHSMVQGSDALLGNPAGLASVTGAVVGVHHESWLADINQETGFAVLPLAKGWGLGIYGHVIDYGTFETRDSSGQKLGSITPRDYAVGLGLGAQLRSGFEVGCAVRTMRENLVSEDNFTFAMDTGFGWSKGGWTFGLAALNVGISSNGSTGAESVRGSLGRHFLWQQGWVWPAAGFTWEPRGISRAHFGTEIRLNPMLDLRAGYEHRFIETLADGLQGMTLGLGFRLGQASVDYAYLPYGDLGAGHRLSLSWRLG